MSCVLLWCCCCCLVEAMGDAMVVAFLEIVCFSELCGKLGERRVLLIRSDVCREYACGSFQID